MKTYLLRRGLALLRESWVASLLTTCTIGAALLVVGMYVMALHNARSLALVWGRAARVSVVLADTVPKDQWETLRRRIQAIKPIRHANLVTPQEALERFKARGPSSAALVENAAADILPATVELDLDANDLASVTQLARTLESLEGVAEINYGREQFDALQTVLRILTQGGIIAGLGLAFAVAFIISNIIRLTVFARRDEIAVLQLVGGAPWFIRTPFMIEGLVAGGLGGGLAAATLLLGERLLAPRLTLALSQTIDGLSVHLFNRGIAASLVLAGMSLGLTGGALAARRFCPIETELE